MKRIKIVIPVLLVFLLCFNVFAENKIVLNYWTQTDDNRTALENRYIQEFEKANPNVEIKRVTNESSKMADLLLTAFSANNGPDLFNLTIDQEYAYMVNGRVAPVDYRA
ncbi:MAG TPA: extracellular solute-binding protein, partial [Bacillota bacterium]